jgi:phosphatidylglycerol:prolipoprotein diacylglycerol transferase
MILPHLSNGMEEFYHHDLPTFLIRFPENWPIEGIRYYGLSYVAGFVGAWLILRFYFRTGRSPINSEQLTNLMFALIVGVALGGRLGYMVFYDLSTLLRDPLQAIRVWEGGMASHGGMVGVGLALLYFAKTEKIPFFQLSDLICSVASLGICFGRIANYINGELWGTQARVPWAVVFREFDSVTGTYLYTIPRHPSQIYQALLEGLLLFAFIQYRFWRGKNLRFGRLTGEYLIGYAILRIIAEQFRVPDADLILGMSRGTFYSIFLIAVGATCIWVSGKNSSHPRPDAA